MPMHAAVHWLKRDVLYSKEVEISCDFTLGKFSNFLSVW